MYPAPLYTETDPAFAARMMREHSFACLTSVTADGLRATHAPLALVAGEGPHGTLYGHLSAENPQCASFDGQHEAMAVFNGPHAYVSPLWVRDPSREVPTWDYVSVQATGRPVALPQEENERLIGELVETYEGQGGWKVAGMKPDYRDKLMHRVVAFRMPIGKLLCVRKMHQNRAQEDRLLIVARLREAGEHGTADAIAAVG
jgi:transcriptional regulator